jgi:glutaredoxin-like protein NrdH
MRNRGIKSTKVLVNEDADALAYIKSLGYSEAPVIVVTEGDEVLDHWSGFSDEKISQLKEMVAA